MTKEEVTAAFVVAGLDVAKVWQLPNGHMGSMEPLTDDQITIDSPGVPGMRVIDDTKSEGVVRAWMSDYRWCHERLAWLVKTQYGLIEITPRKRVIEIDWFDTRVRIPDLTQDQVTKGIFHVHAWDMIKLVDYLTRLSTILRKANADRGRF